MNNVYILLIEICPLRHSKLYHQDPRVIGAFVHCVVSAKNEKYANKMAIEALSKDGYNYVKVSEIWSFDDFIIDDEVERKRFLKMASEASKGIVGFGDFYCYYKEDE